MSARGKVSQRSAPKQNVSQRTSSRSAPAPPSERSAPSQPPGAAPGEEQDTATKILTTIQNILTSIANFFYNLYLVIKFIVTKPDVAWDLVSTSFHLMKVSKEAGLWSWNQLWEYVLRTNSRTDDSSAKNRRRSKRKLVTA
ncbi:hypothetical protein OSTOST_20929 [Ostertagia ostertagi]